MKVHFHIIMKVHFHISTYWYTTSNDLGTTDLSDFFLYDYSPTYHITSGYYHKTFCMLIYGLYNV